jgi:hypothetical protein
MACNTGRALVVGWVQKQDSVELFALNIKLLT